MRQEILDSPTRFGLRVTEADHPLAYRDARSVAASRRGRVVALRTYDSDRVEPGLPFWTLHSAFRDPHVPDAPGHRRDSVETRALCLWV